MYEQFAEFYDLWHDDLWYGERIDFLLRKADLFPGDRVYEGGCGSGHLTKELAEAGLAVTATDISPPMLKLAEKRLEGYFVQIFREDLRALPKRTGYKAFIFCLDVIHYLTIEETARLFSTVYRSLPAGGFLIFDHLPEKVIRQRAKEPPIFFQSPDRRMRWETFAEGDRARYELYLQHGKRRMKETQRLQIYKKRWIRRLLFRSGKWKVQGFGEYADVPMHPSAERFVWFAKKIETGNT